MFQEGNRSEVGRTRLLVALVFSAVGILAVAAASFPGWGLEPASNLAPHQGRQPLSAQQRLDAARYWNSKRGLQFGIPKGAYRNAVSTMHRMESTQASLPASLAAVSAPFAWNFIGPQPMLNAQSNFGGNLFGAKFNATGRITAVAVDQGNPARIVVGAASGGVWLSTDTGQTFTPIGDSLPTTVIGAIALDSVNTSPPTIYVGTGENNNGIDSYYGHGIFKSTNLGQTWIPLAPGTFDKASVGRIAIDTTHLTTLFAAVGDQITGGRADPLLFPADPTIPGLWRSTDGGNNWTHYPATTFGCNQNNTNADPCAAEDVAIDPAFPQSVYAAINGDDVFHSTDGGSTWSPVCFSNDSPCTFPSGNGQMDRPSVVVSNRVVYAMIGSSDGSSYKGFFRSSNDGLTWTAGSVPSATLGGVTIDGSSGFNFSQEFYDQALLIDPADSTHNTVFFGGIGIYESTDGGTSWAFLAGNGGVHSDQHALAIAPNNDTIYLGDDGGLFTFNISGISAGTATFTALNNTLAVGQIQGIGPHPTNSSKVLAGFQDNGTQLYSGSLGWSSVETGDGGFTLFDLINPAFAYHTFATTGGGGRANIGVSQDGGSTWSDGALTGDSFSFYPPLASDPSLSNRVFLGGHTIHVSTDSMATFSLETTQDLTGGCTGNAASLCALQDIEFTPGNHFNAWSLSTQFGNAPFKVFNTNQANQAANATWSDVTPNLNAAFPSGLTTLNTQATGITPFPNNINAAYISLSGFTSQTGIGHVYKTGDFGASWTRADGAGGTSPLPDVPVLRILVDSTDGTGNRVIAGTDIGAFISTDGGATWQPFNLGVVPNVPVYDAEQNGNGDIFIGTHGRGAYQLVHATPSPTMVPPPPTATPTPTQTPFPTPTPVQTPAPIPGDTIADGVLGQPDYYHNAQYPTSVDDVNFPGEVVFDFSANPPHVYVSDEPASRVLGWNDIHAFSTQAPADIVIGQPDFTSTGCDKGGSITAKTLCLSNGIPGIAVDHNGTLYVSDGGNGRVLGYLNPFGQGIQAGFSANLVFGQPNDHTAGQCNNNPADGTVNPNDVCFPSGLAVDAANDLIVADQGNNRVLIYRDPTNPTHGNGSPGMAGDTTADFVIGQGSAGNNFSTQACGSPNPQSGQVPISASTLCAPQGVAVDGIGNVWVADSFNSRLLEYNTPINANGDPGSGDATADKVVGQPDFTTTDCPETSPNVRVSADSICFPNDISMDFDGNLYVMDGVGSGRILEYNQPLAPGGGTPGTPGSAGDGTADRVYGTGNSFKATPQCNAFGLGPDSLCNPQGSGISPHSELLAIADTGNSRVLAFAFPLSAIPSPTATPAATPTPAPTSTGRTATPTPTAMGTSSHTATPTPTSTSTPAMCPTGLTNCSNSSNLVCVDLLNDVHNCGSCGNTCSSSQICSAGVCSNPPTATPTPVSSGTLQCIVPPKPFGPAPLGVAAKPGKVTIKNVGTGPLSGTVETTSASSPFQITSGSGSFILAPKKLEKLGIAFTPGNTFVTSITVGNPPMDNYADTIKIVSSDPTGNHLQTCSIAGIGIPPQLGIEAKVGKKKKPVIITEVDFPPIAHGTSESSIVMLTNVRTGIGAKALLTGSVGQPSDSTFMVTNNAGSFSIPAKQFYNVTIQFSPKAAGSFNSVVPIVVNVPTLDGTNKVTINLKVTGTGS